MDDIKPIIIITGASGNIGKVLTKALSHQYQVVGFDRDEDSDIPIDLASEASIVTAFKLFKKKYNDKIAVVIHLAAYFDFTGDASPLYDTVNVLGTKKLLHCLQDFDVERFIFASTMLVHEPGKPGGVINEASPLGPKWAYPESKRKTEEVIQRSHGKIPYLILRLSGLYDDTSCVPTLAHQIARTYERNIKRHFYAGDVQAGQSFIHQDDLVSLFEKAIEYRNTLNSEEIILAGEPQGVSYETLQKTINHLVHEEQTDVINLPKPIAKAGAWIEEKLEPILPDDFDQGNKPFIKPFMIDMASDHYALDISKAQKLLHWRPKHTIKESLPKIIQALKDDPKGWYEQHKIPLPDWLQTLSSQDDPDAMRNQFEERFRQEHGENLWARFLNIGLGFWLITSPLMMPYQSTYLLISDVTSGFLLIILSCLCLSWRFAMLRWACACIGLWLISAPLIFWAPTAAVYLNNTLIGSLIIGFSVLIRPEIGVSINAAMTGSDIPPGWNYSPSNWFQRLPIIILAFIGLIISRYMAAYQLGHIDSVWDPFFTSTVPNLNGTEYIITSYLSEAWPVPDAGLGAMVYLLEIVTGLMGGSNRWRTMPWLVILFGLLIVPLGVVSITFIIIQPILLNTWCTLCLIAAAVMLIQIPYSVNELIATGLFLKRQKKAGRPFWRILFVGDSEDTHAARLHPDNFEQSAREILYQNLKEDVSMPWNLLCCMLIGIWLTLTRITLNTSGGMANADHLLGALIITVTVISLAEPARAVRFINLLFAMALFIMPFVFGATMIATFASVICGFLLFALTLPRGHVTKAYGEWNKYIF